MSNADLLAGRESGRERRPASSWSRPPRRRIAMSTHVLAGSIREPLTGARPAGKANPAERLEVTVLVRRQNADAFRAKVAKLAAGDPPEAYLGRADFAGQFGSSLVDLAAVEEFAKRYGLAVVQADAARRTVVLSGT